MTDDEQKIDPVEESKKQEKPAGRPRHHIRGIWAVTLILALCAILGGAVWYFILPNNNDDSSFNFRIDNSSKKEKKKEEETKKGLKTYTNLSALFSFDYPETWAFSEQSNSLIISSDTAYPQAYLDGKGPEMQETEIYIQIHFSNLSIDISREAPAIKPKFSTIKIGGVKAERVTYKNETDFQEIIQNFKAGDFYFLIICDTKTKNAGKIDSYNKMLDSFKFDNDVINSNR